MSAALCSIGAPAIVAEMKEHSDSFQSSVIVLCDDILKKCDAKDIYVDAAGKQLVMDLFT